MFGWKRVLWLNNRVFSHFNFQQSKIEVTTIFGVLSLILTFYCILNFQHLLESLKILGRTFLDLEGLSTGV